MSSGSVSGNAKAMLGSQFTEAPTRVSLSGSTATSAQLSPGLYRMISTVACFIKQGGSTITAAATDSYLPADVVDWLYVSVDDNASTSTDYVAGITGGGTGTLYLTRV